MKNKFGVKEEIERQLEAYVEDVLIKSKWSMDQRRHYHNLYAIQKIKRNIFSDKILICKEGFYAFGIFPKSSIDERALPRFMVLRSAILFRISDYIARLGDHQEDFSKSLDMGLQDHPRPSMERRREQRIYTTYLSQSCLDLWLEIKMLVDGKLSEPDKKKEFKSQVLDKIIKAYISDCCNKIYDIKSESFALSEENNLFEHIYDIPWQSSFLEGLDAVDKMNSQFKRIEWVNQLHEFSITTRKIYQVALDFHIGHVDYFPYLRLRRCLKSKNSKKIIAPYDMN